MTMIVQNGDPVLRQKAKPVTDDMFGSPELRTILSTMREALDSEPDGVAIAAPQIGVSYRIFMVRYDRMLPPPADDVPVPPPEYGVYINPVFIRASRRRLEMNEGCLSVRGLYGTTLRHDRATMRAKDENGHSFERGGGGILAQAFQHETDHLEGILFIDHAADITEVRHHEENEKEDHGY